VRAPDDPDDPLQSVLAGLAVSARQSNVARSDVVAEALAAAAEGRLDPARRMAAVKAAHQVVGSAGTFGSARASELAAALEQVLGGEGPLDPAALLLAQQRLAELRRELGAGHQGEE